MCYSPIPAGATPQDSYIAVVKWIKHTVTSLTLYNGPKNNVGGTPPPPGPSPPHIQHETFDIIITGYNNICLLYKPCFKTLKR